MMEITAHLLQPYPFVQYHFKIITVGQNITYTINILFYFLTLIRVYIVVKFLRYWNLYSKRRSKKIVKLFDKSANSDLFMYKANLTKRGFITLCFLGMFVLLMSSLMLKVCEYTHYSEENKDSNKFYYYWNNLWFLIVTMCTSKINII